MFKELLSGSEIRISTLAFGFVFILFTYLFVVIFNVFKPIEITLLTLILDNLKGVLGFLVAGVCGNGIVSVGKDAVVAKMGNVKDNSATVE